MRNAIFGAVGVLAFASPALAADMTVTRYSQVPAYEREVEVREYRTAPRVVVEEPAPIVSETVVVRRPVVVAPPVEFEEYPVYPAPRLYAYGGPVWRGEWGHRRHFHGGW